eukprot:GHVL01014698.1.p1 GENE.GHVL01014698.1~~GHVL01014698.1.p1  ORF type:complete len:123 (-),score=5.15 GHVL01014698.1:172-540(-)
MTTATRITLKAGVYSDATCRTGVFVRRTLASHWPVECLMDNGQTVFLNDSDFTGSNGAAFHLNIARDAVMLARAGGPNAAWHWSVAVSQLCKAIGAANREGNRKASGLALLALAKVRAVSAA